MKARGFGALCLAACMGCSTTASIYRSDGMLIEGSIKGGSYDHITVETKYGGYQEIPRKEIKEIDHPGNVHALIGGFVLGYGVLNVAVGWDECQNREEAQAAFCTGLFIPAAVGVGMMIWGLGTWVGSKNAADDISHPSLEEKSTPKPAPAALPPAPPAPSAAPPPAPAPAPAAPTTAPEPAPAPNAPPSDSWAPAPPQPAPTP